MRPWLVTLCLMLLSACPTGRASDHADSLQGAAQAERIEELMDWGTLRDSVAVSLETPAQLQQHENAYIVPQGGQRIPVTRLVVQVDLLMDFTCPACLETHAVVMDLLRGSLFSTRNLIHFPVTGHPAAMEAAQAFECADRDGQGREMYKALYEGQNDLGTRTWASYAHEAVVSDTVAFNRCMAGPPSPRIQAGIDLGNRFQITGPPAVVIDGTLIHPPTPDRLYDALENAAARRRRG